MQDVIKELSLTTGLDPRVITVITNHPFRFVRNCMANKDKRAVRLRNLGVFSSYAYKNKRDINQRRIDRLLDGTHDVEIMAYYEVDSMDKVKYVLEQLLSHWEYRLILTAYKAIIHKI